jgi:NAD+ kinase
MGYMMKSFHVVRKLDNADSTVVNTLVDRIKVTCAALNVFENFDLRENVETVIFAVGGDGTLLHALQLSAATGYPVVGFNIGKLGFLAEFPPQAIEIAIIDVMSGNCKTDRRMLLEASDSNHDWTPAVNEFVISPALASKTLRYEFLVNNISSGVHHANALLISTPTGSTAYSLSVGGAILDPEMAAIQITAVAPMSLNSRSVVVSAKNRVCVRVHSGARKGEVDEEYQLVKDGQVVNSQLLASGCQHDYCFKAQEARGTLLHAESWNFFSVLKEKLRWNTVI